MKDEDNKTIEIQIENPNLGKHEAALKIRYKGHN